MITLEQHIEDLIEHLKSLNYSKYTLKTLRNNLKLFTKYLEDNFNVTTPSELKISHLRARHRHLCQRKTCRGLPLKVRTLNKHIEGLRVFLNYLEENGYIISKLRSSVQYVKEPYFLPSTIMEHKQAKKFLGSIDTSTPTGYRDRTMFELLYTTGIRAGEFAGIDLKDVDLARHTAIVTGKGRKQRVVPIGKTALRYLETYIKAIRCFLLKDPVQEALFLNFDGGRLQAQTLAILAHRYSEKAKLNINLTPHVFRRSCATELIREGANMYHVKELLGHESLDTLKHYVKLTINDLKKTHAKCHPREKDS